MLNRPALRRRLAGLGALAATSTALVVVVPAPADAAYGVPCDGVNDFQRPDEILQDDEPSGPYVELQLDRVNEVLAQRGVKPGEGVRVAVLDSAVTGANAEASDALTYFENPVVPTLPPFPAVPPDTTYLYYHGTAVAGVIAGAPREDGGPVGVAPSATVITVPVYSQGEAGSSSEETDGVPLSIDNVVDGLDRAMDARADIVNMSFAFDGPSDVLAAKLREVTRTGAIVVTSTGNRPSQEVESSDPFSEFATFEPGEDAAESVYPAYYAKPGRDHIEGVIAVNSTVDSGEPTDAVLQNSATTVAAPSANVVSYAVNGLQSCRIIEPSTSFAAAEVSGILALLMSAFDEKPQQTVARLLDTAAGPGRYNPEQPDKLTGYGVVQPLEALTNQAVSNKKGEVPRSAQLDDPPEAAVVAPPAADPLSETRKDAVWWGLVGGGALVVAALLRPVLARRRRG